jgi:hypothetical protein
MGAGRRHADSHGEPNPEILGAILPGAAQEKRRTFPSGTNMAVSGAVLLFRDAAGIVCRLLRAA